MKRCRALSMFAFIAAACSSSRAAAQDAWSWEAVYKGDIIGYDGGSGRRGGAALDLLSVVGEADLEALVGASGLRAGLHIENSSGAEPNARLETLRGFNNSEVSRPRLRLYEAWVAQSFAGGRADLLVGLYDFNSEFYVTEAAQAFLSPGFGIGSEIAVSGPGGPSIYPSTGLAVRLKTTLGERGYLQGVAINANVGDPGDPSRVDLTYSNGLLLAAESGLTGSHGRVALGAWAYTKAVEPAWPGEAKRSQGAYLLVERRLGGESGRATAFLRVGVSDGETTPVAGGFQTGLVISPAFQSRTHSVFAIGLDHAALSEPERDFRRAAGQEVGRGEAGLEITYLDQVNDWLTLQPDLQVIFAPQGDPSRNTAAVLSIRFTATLGRPTEP